MMLEANAIPEKPKKKIIRRKIGTKERFTRLIQSQGNDIIKHWFSNNEKKKELYIEFEKVNADIGDIIHEIYNEFIDNCFNDWETGFDFHYENEQEINDEFDLADFVSFFNDCQEWFKDEYNINLLIKNKTTAWNSIAYWLVKVDDLLFTEINDLIQEKYNNYLDSKRTSRIACGICFENKILYTGCSCCNGNYICYQCYDWLAKKNTCPYCRCDEMIYSEPPQTAYSPEEINDKKELMITLKRYTENPVMDKCEDCQCDIRYRDKSHYYIVEEGVRVESLFCGDCFKKDR